MTYIITGLSPTTFAELVGLSDAALAMHGAVRVTADAKPGYPCRVTLEDAEPGETLLLVNHCSHAAATPYRATHAVYVREGARAAASHLDRTPPVFAHRTLSLRGFDETGMLLDAALAAPGEADAVIRRMLADPAIDHIDAHNAAPGCFAARVDRA